MGHTTASKELEVRMTPEELRYLVACGAALLQRPGWFSFNLYPLLQGTDN